LIQSRLAGIGGVHAPQGLDLAKDQRGQMTRIDGRSGQTEPVQTILATCSMAGRGLQVVIAHVLPPPPSDRRVRAGGCVKGIGLLALRLIVAVMMLMSMI